METQLIVSLFIGLFGIGTGAGVLLLIRNLSDEKKKRAADIEAERVINRAKSEAQKIEKESKRRAQDFEARAKKNAEAEIQKNKQKIASLQQELEKKSSRLDSTLKEKQDEAQRKLAKIEEKEALAAQLEQTAKSLEKDAQELKLKLEQKLADMAKLSQEEAKEQLLQELEGKIKLEAIKRAQAVEEEIQKEAKLKARRVLAQAVSRYASEYVAEKTVSVVTLPSDELKGKIIGREGRNVRTLENLCGVDLIIDDTPEAVVISCFDPVRREIAKRSLEKLIEDGRVHPARIEEVVDRVKSDFFKTFKELGEKAAFDLAIPNLHPELLKLLGSLKYRTTGAADNYSQSVEMGFIAGLIAGEIGLNVKLAKRAGLLHAVGKAVDHTVEGSYAQVGAEVAKRYNESDVICQAIRCHNGEESAVSGMDHVLQASFALVSQRPGGRRGHFQSYINRLEDLESTANSFEGVLKSFALQAGREVRVLVESRLVTDDQAQMLSRDIARKIERDMSYPGQVVVSVVREARAVEHAR